MRLLWYRQVFLQYPMLVAHELKLVVVTQVISGYRHEQFGPKHQNTICNMTIYSIAETFIK